MAAACSDRPLEDEERWAGERWLDIRSENVLAVMLDRLDLAVDKGCDGVEPDNMDAYTNRSGFRLTADDPLGWNKRIANEAHLPALAVALKNDGDQAAALVEHFDLSVNEQCHEYAECDQLAPFISAGKLRRVAGYRPFVDRDEHRAAFHTAVVSPLGGSTNGR